MVCCNAYAVCCYATLALLSLAPYLVASSELQEASLLGGTVDGRIIYVNGTDPSAADNETCWEGHPTLPCKNLTFALRGVTDSTTIVIAEGEYYVRPDPNLTFVGVNAITLEGRGMFVTSEDDTYPSVRVICDDHAGLTFINSSQVTILNIEFTSCDGLHPSTSRDFSNTTTFSFLEFPAALYFLFCSDISFTNVVVTHSNGTGVVLYSTVGTNVFQGCNFSYNSVVNSPYPGGGGLYIEFPYCSPNDPAACNNGIPAIPPNYTKNAVYIINATYFGYNTGSMTNPIDFTVLLSQYKNHLSFGRGGGLSIFVSDARNISVEVHSSVFEANTAYWGGGAFVEFQEKSYNNTFTMNACTIKNNECRHIEGYTQTTGGGGMRLGFIFVNNTYTSSNHMKFNNCTFTNNHAYWGGGVSLNAAREANKTEPSNTLHFVDCTWSGNMGRTGSAVDLSLWNYPSSGVAIKPTFTNCRFKDNDDKYGESVGKIVGVGTVYVDSLPLVFEQFVHFDGNQRSALVAIESLVDFSEDCVANFTHNRGITGGAISLFGYAYIRVGENTKLYFINNSASEYGGAINARAVGQHGLVSFSNCFIQYHNPSIELSNWTALFYFKGNTAGYTGGCNSISAISLVPCLWGSYRPSKHTSKEDARMMFCRSDNFQFVNRTCDEEISSAPASFSNNQTKYSIKAIPGKPCQMGIRTFDDSGKDSTNRTVLNARSNSPNVAIANSSLYISDDTIVLVGQPYAKGTLGIQTFIPRVLHTEVEVEFLPCPPGFVLSVENGYTTCICGGTYSGAVLCRGLETNASLQNGHWMGSYNVSGNTSLTVVGMCGYTKTSAREEFVPLTNDSSSLDEHLCMNSGRTGVLCGDCLPGYGPALNTRFYKCLNCSSDQAKYNWIFFVLSAFVPVTVFFFIVVIFHISATRGIANAFIFFAQVLTTTFDIDGDGTIPLRNITSAADTLQVLYTIPYEIWNLDFFSHVLPSYCLSPHLSTLGLISLNYLIAAYPLLLILIFYAFVSLYNRGIQPIFCLCRPVHQFFARWQRTWNLQRSTVDAFATFLVLSYTKFTVVSVFLLTPVPLVDDGGNTIAAVLYYDGNIGFLSKEHIPFFLLALFVLISFVLIPPILLLVYPLKITQKVASCIGLKRLETGGRLQMFLDTFQGCYKDGTDDSQDRRYFAGVYFVLRTVLFTLYGFTGMWMRQYIVQQLICTAGILLFAIMRPYKKNFYNNLDATVFSILAAVNTLSMYNCYLSAVALPLSSWAFGMQYILIFCPLMFMIGYIVWHIWNANRKRLKAHLGKALMKCCRCFGPHGDGVGLISILSDAGTPTSSVIDEDFLSFARTVESCGRDQRLNYCRHPSSDPSSVSHLSSGEVEPTSVPSASNSETAPLIRTIGKKKKKVSNSSAGYGGTSTGTDKQQGAASSKTTE